MLKIKIEKGKLATDLLMPKEGAERTFLKQKTQLKLTLLGTKM